MSSPQPRHLIVNADDFGRSRGVNRGVVEAHDYGVVTSASLMVRWPAAREAVVLAKARPRLSLGLHVDLCEWVYRDRAWTPLYEVVPTDDRRAVASEVKRQLTAFRRLVGGDVTHLDTHQHVHQEEPVRSVLVDLAHELGVPLRGNSADIHFCGAFYGQTGRGEPLLEGITRESLRRILEMLPAGVTELSCHPGLDEDFDSVYRAERAQEVAVLCDPVLPAAMRELGVELRSFGDL